MSNVTDLQNALLDATKLLSDKSVDEAKYTYTIKCTIKGIENAGLNLYKVEYGANTFNAYANNGMSYSIGDIVYVLIPEGDFTQEKQIIGSSAPRESMYVPEVESDIYVTCSDNLISGMSNVDLKSWEDEETKISYTDTYFKTVFGNYLENGIRHFKFSTKVKTEIDKDHQVKGNYGLKLYVPVKRINTDGTEVGDTQVFVIDINTMQGSVYNFNEYALQELYFELNENYTYDNSRDIELYKFVSGFGYLETPENAPPADIHFRDIFFEMVDVLTLEESQGYSLKVVGDNGNCFLASKEILYKTLSPVLKVKGKTVTNLKNWECYWFVEDSSIDTTSNYYLNFGGLGWKCLNKKTNVTYDETGKESYQLVTNNYSYTLTNEDVVSTLKYKCVMVQGSTIVNGEIKIKNLSSHYKISLFSKTGSNTFVENIGYAVLVARAHLLTDLDDNHLLDIKWQRFDKNDNYIDDNFYEVVRKNDRIEEGGIVYYETEIKYPCSKLDQINTVHCTFYDIHVKETTTVITVETDTGPVEETIIGKTETVTNIGSCSLLVSTSKDFVYRLVIDGGDVLYKYDADGDSPMVANYDGPLTSRVSTIEPLSYRIYKADGTELTDSEYLYCKYKWSFPKNSMMKLTTDYTSKDDNYYYIEGSGKAIADINYTILNTYNKKKNDNSIFLNVKFSDASLNAIVAPKFLKDGAAGTNGTKYSAVIVDQDGFGYGQKDTNGLIRKIQCVYTDIVTKGGDWNWYWCKITDDGKQILEIMSDSKPSVNVEVYSDGEKITDTNSYTVDWEIFDSTDGSSSSIGKNLRCFNIVGNEIQPINNWDNINNIYNNIIQAKVTIKQGNDNNHKEVLYVYYPIEITRIKYNSSYSDFQRIPTLAGGFEQVLYASDGTNPEYDNANPFSCEDNLYASLKDSYDYEWSATNNLKVPSGETSYQCKITPQSIFDGGDSQNYIKVIFNFKTDKEQEIIDEITELNAKITTNNERIAVYNQIDVFNDFLNTFHYEDIKDEQGVVIEQGYITRLKDKDCTALLSARGTGFQTLKEMIKILEELKEYCNSKEGLEYPAVYKEGDQSIDYIQDVNSLIPNLYTLLVTKNITNIKLNDKIQTIVIPTKVKTDFGNSVYQQLKNYATQWSTAVTKYKNKTYNVINAQKTKGLEKIFTIVTELINFSRFYGIEDEHLRAELEKDPDIKELKTQLLTTTTKFYFENGEINTFDDFDEKILKEMDKLIAPFKLEEYQANHYKELIDQLTEENKDYEATKESYQKSLMPSDQNLLIHMKPIIMLYNRYEMSNINGWDGNKLYINNGNNEYLLAPQIGAGIKDTNNTFTGMVMGVKKFNNSANKEVGLFGYGKGIRTIFLDAYTGNAEFGSSGKGLIKITPTEGSITGGNYPSGGMKLDLTKGGIYFGSGNFEVNANGELIAKGDGSIAGWKISDTKLTGGNTTLNSNGTITCEKLIANTDGTIGGWKIGEGTLSYESGENKLTLNGSEGSITGPGFSLSGLSGLALTSGSITMGGVSLNAKDFTMTEDKTKVGTKDLSPYIDDRISTYLAGDHSTGTITAGNIRGAKYYLYNGADYIEIKFATEVPQGAFIAYHQ